MLHVPYWLTGRGVVQLYDEHIEIYTPMHQEFMDVFQDKEREVTKSQKTFITDTLWNAWRFGNFWCFLALGAPSAACDLTSSSTRFSDNRSVRPHNEGSIRTIGHALLAADTAQMIEQKSADKARYEVRLRELFDDEIPGQCKDNIEHQRRESRQVAFKVLLTERLMTLKRRTISSLLSHPIACPAPESLSPELLGLGLLDPKVFSAKLPAPC